VKFSEFQKLRDLDLDVASGRGDTDAHIWSRSTHTPNLIHIGKTFCARKYLRAYGRTDGHT